MTRAVVVFHGRRARLWRRLLRPGFRHCFVAVERDGYWILFDPREGCPELRVLAGSDFDLAAFYRERGFTALDVAVTETFSVLPVMPATCVAAVKRLIGLRAALVLTPWQLYRRLQADVP